MTAENKKRILEILERTTADIIGALALNGEPVECFKLEANFSPDMERFHPDRRFIVEYDARGMRPRT